MPEIEAQQTEQEVVQPEGSVEQPRSESEQGAGQQESERPQKGKGGWQRSINRVTRQRDEAEAKLNQVLDLLQQSLGKTAQTPAAQEQAGDRAKPKHDAVDAQGQPKYPTYEDYLEDLADWKAEQKLTAFKSQQQQETAQKTQQDVFQKSLTEHSKRVDEARKKFDDYDEVIEQVKDEGLDFDSEEVAYSALEQDNSAELLYHLAKNPELIEKLNGMSTTRAIAEIGRIAARLEAAPAKEEAADEEGTRSPEPVTEKQGKPEPIKPVRRSTSETVTSITGKSDAEDKLSADEWLRRRNAQIAKG